MVGAVAEVIGACLDGRPAISRQRLVEHLTELVVDATRVSSAG
jgi:hypothetical protein